MTLTRSLTAFALCAFPLLAADAVPNARQIFDRQLSNTEREVVGLTEAMPADKFNFAPTNGLFTGVRTFALEAKHIAFEINCVASACWASRFRARSTTTGPTISPRKTEIVKYLKDAFAHAHRAVATMTNDNLLELTTDPFNPKGKSTRVASVGIFSWHTYDHYGQMVEYLRMNGIKPPASR